MLGKESESSTSEDPVSVPIFGPTSNVELKSITHKQPSESMAPDPPITAVSHSDRDFILSALKTTVDALVYAANSLKEDANFILDAIKVNVDALRYAADPLKEDKNFILDAIKVNVHAFSYAPDSLKKDEEVMRAVIEQKHDILQSANGAVMLSGPLSEYLLAFVPTHEFFMVLPRVSRRYYQRLVSDRPGVLHDSQTGRARDALHQRQSQTRFLMTDKQWELFSATSWPLLQMPITQYAQLGPDMLAAIATTERLPPKRWSVECLYLYHHVYYASLYLFRHAPAYTRCGRQLMYHLPLLFQALLIDQLTSFYVYHPLCGYQGLQYLRRQLLLEVDYFYFNTLNMKPASRQMPARNVAAGAPPNEDSAHQDLDEAAREELSQSLIEWWLTLPHDQKVDSHGHISLFEDEMITIAYSYEKDGSRRGFRRHVPKSRERLSYFVHLLWFGSELRRLEVTLQAAVQSSHTIQPSRVDVNLQEALIVPMALELEEFDFHPSFFHTNTFISQGGLAGTLHVGDAYRINKWLYPSLALHCPLHANGNAWSSLRSVAVRVDEDQKRRRNTTSRAHPPLILAFDRELHSVWWEKEHQEYLQMQGQQHSGSWISAKDPPSSSMSQHELAMSQEFGEFFNNLSTRLLHLKSMYGERQNWTRNQ